ncbi:MAG: hypothetical protein PVF51_08000 [Nitrospirota bacterium]|jgi:hypothetical protein
MRLLAVVFVLLTAVYGSGASNALAFSPDDPQDEPSWDVQDEPMDDPMDDPAYDDPYPGTFDDEGEMDDDQPEYPDDSPAEEDLRY